MMARSCLPRLQLTRPLLQVSATRPTLPPACCQQLHARYRAFGAKPEYAPVIKAYKKLDHTNMSFETVLVRVGKPSVDIVAYRELICSVSTFFRGAIDRSFLGKYEGTITLRDVRESTFRTFLAWCHAQCLPGSSPDGLLVSTKHHKDNARLPGPSKKSQTLTGRGRPRKRIFDEYVSGKSPLLRVIGAEELDKHFHRNPSWQGTYQEVVKALVRLYIFADRYNIPQLRDDVMSTYIGYCISHGLYPDPDDVEVIDLAYSKLPTTAMLSRYFVLSTIYFWTPNKLTLESGKLERLHPGFTLDVMTAQAQRAQPPEEGQTDATKTVPQLAKYGLRNSCVFHEHQVVGREQCRFRLTHNKFIFDGLLDACVKEAEAIMSKGRS
ncbi:hypothetical protein DE146DRAFT_184075 [Phaeosphaeria sp. MPI-PUGE-AT-0046c]|nr:hypothetical protein DE146DRAFT_184075 [Phaeosphaeria sp. MPI-PUGE-AT-0046c]